MTEFQDVLAIRRPHKNLLKVYMLQSLAAFFVFPIVALPMYFKYHTLKYEFTDEGISASWGILFKREIYITYRRIQDIHVSRNLFERWLGIGKVDLQTASGSASAELSLEGMEHYERVRDFLYGQMRGVKEEATKEGEGDDVTALLGEIRDELRAATAALQNGGRA